MRINTDPRFPQSDDVRALKQKLYDNHRDIATQVNCLAEGMLSGVTNAAPSKPTSGTYAKGDLVRNSAPAELGAAAQKYIVFGWFCLAAPLTFVEMRFFTGN